MAEEGSNTETQDEMIANLYRYMRVTVDMQEVMLKRLNVISYALVTLVVVALISLLVLMTQ